MRPVRLDLDGFAAFRHPTSIDFDGVDYFALVGATGSGKSTLIDAIVFALYGTAPRWGRRNAIEYALAPTATSARVGLVFDLGDQRYTVAREVRRTGRTITQRTTSLERLLDPADPTHTEVLAADPKGIGAAIETLIGLSYEDFTQCVVLPQGQFADFLRARNADRQTILLKLLGADRYERIRVAAHTRAAQAQAQVDHLTARVQTLADATEASVEAAQARVQALTEGRAALQDLAGRWAGAHRQAEQATDAVDRARAALTVLAGVQVPPDLTGLQAEATRTAQAARTADQDAARAAAAHRRARADLDRAPDPGPLQTRRAHWVEHDELLAARSATAAAAHQAQTAAAAAGQALTAATAAEHDARQGLVTAEAVLQQATTGLDALTAREQALRAVRVPPGLAGLAARLQEATTRDTHARTALDRAQHAEDRAHAAAEDAPEVSVLDRAVTLATTVHTLTADLDPARDRLTAAEHRAAAADQCLARARAADRDSESAWQQARTADLAAAVRAGLTDGEDCPVCGSTVHDLPPPQARDKLEAATAARAQAADALTRAQDTAARAAAAAAQARADHDRLTGRIADLTDDLHRLVPHGPTSIAALQAAAAQARTTHQALQQARTGTRTAQARATQARTDLEAAHRGLDTARAAYRAALLTCAPLGYTPCDSDNPATQWDHLDTWRAGDLTTTGHALTRARQDAAQATGDAEHARDRLSGAGTGRQHAQATAMRAQVEEGTARRALTDLDTRLAALTAALAGGPDLAATTAALAARDVLARAEQDTYRQAHTASETADTARRTHTAAEAALARSRDDLAGLVTALAGLDPPRVDLTDLTAAWRTLTTWAGTTRTTLEQDRLPALEEAAARARAQVTAQQSDLGRLVADLQLTTTGALDPHRVEVALADATARARATLGSVRARAAERLTLTGQAQAAADQQKVAAHLADLLRANKFQGWLAGAALDTLVQGASGALRVLSGGQFDLTHDKGEFYVVDHTDADSLRSVRTLSGGETFQASLALALTLSEHLSSLQTTGAARLDSIFLDEGFGTLDADSLDVVAATLEKLTESERMVGIVTHVGALADRVPVRFAVTRDAQSATVTREEM